MNEAVRTDDMKSLEFPEESPMVLRHQRCRDIFGQAIVFREVSAVEAIRGQCFRSTNLSPGLEGDLSVEETLEHRLMVAAQENRLDVGSARQKAGDDPARFRTSIDIVAEVNLGGPSRWVLAPIPVDRCMRLDEAIQPAMDISDHIDTIRLF